MATKTSGEIEQEFLDNLKRSTGKELNEWMAHIAGSGVSKRNDIIKWLKEKNGFGHMNASLLAGISPEWRQAGLWQHRRSFG